MIIEDERLSKISEFYDTETDQYDTGYSSLVCKAEDAVVADVLRPFINGKVLDIGAGSGLLCEMLDIKDYVGIELSPKMTHQAKVKFPDKDFMVADMHHLPFTTHSFDSAVSLYGPLSYSLDPEVLLEEIKRVVKPGGHIALMPYTLRVGNNLEIGGYSTATEPGIEKIFYTEDMLYKLLSSLEDTHVEGINYFLNTYVSFVQAMHLNSEQSLDMFVDFLRREQTLAGLVPPDYARHMIGVGRKSF